MEMNKDIIKLLIEEAGIKDYKINKDLSVVFNSDAHFDSKVCPMLKQAIVKNLGIFPFKIAEAKGSIILSRMFLVSLINMPEKVGGTFNVSSNKLRSLVHCPKEIGNDFIISGNKDVTTLDFGPVVVGGDYEAANCSLVTCAQLPLVIGKDLRLSDNKLRSIPHDIEIHGDCYLSNNLFIEQPTLIKLSKLLVIENNPCNPSDEFEKNTWG